MTEGGRPLSVFLSNGDRNEIRQFALDGSLRRIIRRTTDPLPITRTERSRVREIAYSLNVVNVPNNQDPINRQRFFEIQFDPLPLRQFHPPVRGLQMDGRGFLWVRDSWDRWSVFSPEGRWLGILHLPLLDWRHWIGEDLVVGLHHDLELGGDRIIGYRLTRDD